MSIHLLVGFIEFQVTNSSRYWRGKIDFLFGTGGRWGFWIGPCYFRVKK